MKLDLPYTICFCYRSEQVLLLHRRKPPNQDRWNGLGGKIEAGETPRQSVIREIIEEAAIDLNATPSLRFAGVVTWGVDGTLTATRQGMYAFLAELPPEHDVWEGEHQTDEGRLAWKSLAWITDEHNTEIVGNVTTCLPHMLAATLPHGYHCDYADDFTRLVRVNIRPFMSDIVRFRLAVYRINYALRLCGRLTTTAPIPWPCGAETALES